MKKSLASLTLVAGCVVVSMACSAPATAFGQAAAASQYRSVPPKQWANRQEESRLLLDVREIIRGGVPLDQANKDKLTTYFNQFLFPQMTAYDDQSLSEMPKRRQDFISMIQKGFSIDQAAHDFIVDMTMKTMQQIALGDFHPAVRYNAMLIIGSMNSQEAGLGTQKQPPVPLKEALPILLRELANPDQIEVVRVAALLGVHRHARMERENSKLNRTQFNDADIRQLIDSMLEIVKLEQPPAGRSEEGHDWMRRRAIEVLAEIGKVDAGGSVATVIEKVVTSDDASDSLRCTAARAIGKLSFTTVQNFDAAGVATKLGQFAVHCCQQEIDRVAQLKQEQEERELREQLALQGPAIRGGRGERQPGGIERPFDPFGSPLGGGLLGEEEEAEWQMLVSKRRLKYQLGSIRTALAGSPTPPATGQPTPTTGLLQRASGAQKATVNDIVTEVDRLLRALDASVTTQDELLEGVSSNMTKLADLVGANSGSETIPGFGPAPGGPAPAAGDQASPNTPVPGAPAPGAPVPGGPAPGAPAPGAPAPGAPQPGAPAPGAPAPGAPRPGV